MACRQRDQGRDRDRPGRRQCSGPRRTRVDPARDCHQATGRTRVREAWTRGVPGAGVAAAARSAMPGYSAVRSRPTDRRRRRVRDRDRPGWRQSSGRPRATVCSADHSPGNSSHAIPVPMKSCQTPAVLRIGTDCSEARHGGRKCWRNKDVARQRWSQYNVIVIYMHTRALTRPSHDSPQLSPEAALAKLSSIGVRVA